MPVRPRFVLAVFALTLVACGGDGGTPLPQPVVGDLTVSLTTPNTQDGALLVRIVGEVKDITPIGNYRVSFNTQGLVTRVIVSGDIANGADLFRVRVPDVGKATTYGGFVEQAASRTDYALLGVGGYVLTLRAK